MCTPYDNGVYPWWTTSSSLAPMRTDLIILQKYLGMYKIPSSFNKRDFSFNNEVLSLSKNSQEWLKASYKGKQSLQSLYKGIMASYHSLLKSFNAFTKQNTLIYIAQVS